MTKTKHNYPARIVEKMTTLQSALYDTANDEPNQADEKYNEWLPDALSVLRERFFTASYLLKGFKVFDVAETGVLWRVVWAPLYPGEFLIQLVTGVETRKVWSWPKLRRVDVEFYTHEAVRRYDEFNGWDAIEDVVDAALGSYHEWKAGRLLRASA